MDEQFTKKFVSGFFSLTLRRAILLAINFATINLILARILPVDYIGVFNIANSILSFFAFFSDIGLAAALIQKRQIEDKDLSTTFSIQEILAVIISLAIFLSAPYLASFYKLDLSGMWLIRILGLGFFLTSLKVIPSVLLERELRFGPLVLTEVIESVSFNSLLIILSFNHFGISAFTYASAVQSVIGVLVIYIIAPWRIKIGIHKSSVKQLISFGLPFQLNSLLALLKDRLVPLVVARMIGSTGVGYVTWAQNLAFMPLEIMNIMSRITFPAFARLQDDREALKHSFEKSIFFISLFFYPLMLGLVSTAPSIITYVVSSRWQNAMPLIYFFSLAAFWACMSSTSTNFLNAIGKINITLKLMVMWTILEWSLTPLLTHFYGFIGVGFASAIISFTSLIPILITKKLINISFLSQTWKPLLSALIMSVFSFFLSTNFVRNPISLLIVVLLSGFLYLGVIVILAKKELKSTLGTFINA